MADALRLSAVRDCAILFADVAGYSSMMGRDERGTLEFIGDCSNMIREAGARHGGELVQVTGDGFLLLFKRTLDAVGFGVELHRLVARRQAGAPAPAAFRVGIHRGAVHNLGGTIHGHAVNIAARLQTEALPGTCVVSETVHDEVRGRCDHAFEAVGAPPLKNIAERMRLYRTPAPGGRAAVEPAAPCIAVLGGLSVHAGADEIAVAGRKAAALLGYLALTDGMRERVDKLAPLLWPDASLANARRAFRDCRERLSRQLAAAPQAAVHVTAGHVSLNELSLETDLQLILSALRRGRVAPQLLEMPGWPGRILEGLEGVSPVYAGWLEVKRSVWRTRIMGELSALAGRCPPGDETCGAAARAVLSAEPGNEAASATLIRHHAASGNRAAALEEHARLERHLAAAHGLAPGADVARALDEATRGAVGASAAPARRRRLGRGV